MASVQICCSELQCKQIKIEHIRHEMALLKRWKFAARSEQLYATQRNLLDETHFDELLPHSWMSAAFPR